MENNQLTTNALVIGLETLSSEDIKISANNIEALANLKEILRAILNGNLVLATPERVIPESVELPKQEKESPKKGE
jgi:hypothetical protein